MAPSLESFQDRILGSHLAWLLMEPDGGYRLAVPMDFPALSVGSGASLEGVLAWFAENTGGWGLVVSVPHGLEDRQRVVGTLEFTGARPLQAHEWASVTATGMTDPFGEWADPDWADLFLLGEEGEP